MNGNAKREQIDDGDHLFRIAMLLVLAMIGNHIWKKVGPWYYAHQFQIILLGSTILIALTAVALSYLWNYYVEHIDYNRSITAESDDAVLLGRDEKGREVFLKEQFRTLHAQIIGTTSAGKTESVVLPWAIHDIERGSGLLIVDGKADTSFLDKLYSYVVKSHREDDFRFFSLAHIRQSSVFNPLQEGSSEEIAERVFSSFSIESEYYRAVQYRLFLAALYLLKAANVPASMAAVEKLFVDAAFLEAALGLANGATFAKALQDYSKMPDDKRWELSSGLTSNLGHFTSGDHAVLFNGDGQRISFERALTKNHICYFQLPTMRFPFLGAATGKLVLQCFQSAVSMRHLSFGGGGQPPRFFSCFLDDFQDYIYQGFGALLNKSRSANVGIAFSHQALGDIDKVGPEFRNVVTSNTNVKVVMRTLDPDTCDHFAKTFGTKSSEKMTKRRQRNALGSHDTGEGSVREVEEYRYHPNVIKNLCRGEGVVSIPHPKGVKTLKISFLKREDLPRRSLPEVQKMLPDVVLSNLNAAQTKATCTMATSEKKEPSDEKT